MSWILLSNDDGVDSPALVPFARALGALMEVRVVVPDRERSWIGKAVSRFEPVTMRVVEREGVTIHTSSGFPADASQIGMHALFDTPPAMVVSGINIGMNHGAAFVMSSGTVGAAAEGWISGLPAYAFSTGQPGEDFGVWVRRVSQPDARTAWETLAETCTELLRDMVATDIAEHADVVNVNLPFDANASTERVVADVARTGYSPPFVMADGEQPDGDHVFRHQFGEMTHLGDGIEGSDVAAFGAGRVAITPLRLVETAVIPDATRSALNRP